MVQKRKRKGKSVLLNVSGPPPPPPGGAINRHSMKKNHRDRSIHIEQVQLMLCLQLNILSVRVYYDLYGKNLQLFSPFKHLEMIGRLSWEQSGRPG